MAGRQNAQCEVDREIPSVKLRVTDAITDFSFCPHIVSMIATQNQEWGSSGAQWDYKDRCTAPKGRGAVLTLPILPCSPRFGAHDPFLWFSITGLQHPAINLWS